MTTPAEYLAACLLTVIAGRAPIRMTVTTPTAADAN